MGVTRTSPVYRGGSLLLAGLTIATLLAPASSRADGPDWPYPKGQLAVTGKVASFEAASKMVVVDVKFQLAPDSHRPGYCWWSEKGSYVGKRLTIDLSHTGSKTTIGVKNSHGVTETIRLKDRKWVDPTVGTFFTVYFPIPKGKSVLIASASTSDAP